ncbi:YtxH domain-containing protein [Hathewaya histolytica]|uniref:Gas vesicle protein n=1 Tax=Hathewaya histolytica TaxID=1498 RepID=A0A4U9RPW0_HATHI|nr:YtxH domain-containing protein [Hathewaya histolytica]VTQ93521.1 Gas vesicle protein [Hathewaya histolytica]
MGSKFFRGMTTGALVGIAAGMMMLPSMDRTTRRRIKRAAKTFRGTTTGMMDSMMGMMNR